MFAGLFLTQIRPLVHNTPQLNTAYSSMTGGAVGMCSGK